MNIPLFIHQPGGWAVAALLISMPIASAATVAWDGDTSANWSDAGNWDAAPSNGDSLIFSGTNNQTNTNDIPLGSVAKLTLSNAGWDINIGTLAYAYGDKTLVEATGTSTLTGNITSPTDSALIILNGTDATLTLDGTLTLSRANNVATLTVNNGTGSSGNRLVLGELKMSPGSLRNRTVSGSADVVVNGGITKGGGDANLIKQGTGTLTVNGASTYTGTTTVNAGALIVNGDNSLATGAVTVNTDGTLGGIGKIGGATTVNGSLAPGSAGAGKLSFENALTLAGTVVMEINGLGAGNFDMVALNGLGAAGLLTYGGAMTLDIGSVFSHGDSWDLFDFDGETGTFSSITLTGTVSGSLTDGNADGVWEYASGSDLWTFEESTGILALTAIPEPRVALLGAFGALLLLRRRR